MSLGSGMTNGHGKEAALYEEQMSKVIPWLVHSIIWGAEIYLACFILNGRAEYNAAQTFFPFFLLGAQLAHCYHSIFPFFLIL